MTYRCRQHHMLTHPDPTIQQRTNNKRSTTTTVTAFTRRCLNSSLLLLQLLLLLPLSLSALCIFIVCAIGGKIGAWMRRVMRGRRHKLAALFVLLCCLLICQFLLPLFLPPLYVAILRIAATVAWLWWRKQIIRAQENEEEEAIIELHFTLPRQQRRPLLSQASIRQHQPRILTALVACICILCICGLALARAADTAVHPTHFQTLLRRATSNNTSAAAATALLRQHSITSFPPTAAYFDLRFIPLILAAAFIVFVVFFALHRRRRRKQEEEEERREMLEALDAAFQPPRVLPEFTPWPQPSVPLSTNQAVVAAAEREAATATALPQPPTIRHAELHDVHLSPVAYPLFRIDSRETSGSDEQQLEIHEQSEATAEQPTAIEEKSSHPQQLTPRNAAVVQSPPRFSATAVSAIVILCVCSSPLLSPLLPATADSGLNNDTALNSDAASPDTAAKHDVRHAVEFQVFAALTILWMSLMCCCLVALLIHTVRAGWLRRWHRRHDVRPASAEPEAEEVQVQVQQQQA